MNILRQQLARAMGRALAGERAAVRARPAELPRVADLLQTARVRRLALVVHLAVEGQGEGEGEGDGGWRPPGLPMVRPAALSPAADADAADFAVRLAELAMTPVLVSRAAPAQETDADANPDADADQEIDTPTEGQRIVFGDRRRRLHRFFDVDRPVSLGVIDADDERWSAEAGGRLFFDEAVPALVSRLRDEWAERKGRKAPEVELQLTAPAPQPAASSSATPRPSWQASSWPRRQVLEARLRRALADLDTDLGDAVSPPSAASSLDPPLVSEDRLPLAVRHVGRGEEVWDDVARFWAEHVQPRAAGAPPLPDPHVALAASPAWSATFYDPGRLDDNDRLPVLDTDRCTACGRCWVWCPESSLAPLAVSAADVLENVGSSIEGWTTSLRRHVRGLARRVESALAGGQSWAAAAESSRPWLTETLGADLASLADGWLDAAAGLPLVFTEPGHLLLLAVEPRSCTGCGLCVEECPEDALRLVDRSDPSLGARRQEQAFDLWQRLPDTPGSILDSWIGKQDEATAEVAEVASALLSRSCTGAVAGGVGGARGDGARIAVRQLVALMERLGQHRLVAEAEALERQAEDLCRVDRSAEPAVSAEELEEKLAEAGRLDERRRLLLEGRTGTGRSRFGVVAVGQDVVSWCGRFGRNPFGVPVVAWSESWFPELAVDLAIGLAEAQAARQVAAPILLLVDAEAVASLDLGALERLSAAELPILLAVLGRTSGEVDDCRSTETLLAAGAVAGLPVASCSIADPGQLASAVAAVLGSDSGSNSGPAVLRIHGPSPQVSGQPAAETVSRARRDLEAGRRICFLHRPSHSAPYRFTGDMPDEAARRATAAAEERLGAKHQTELASLAAEHEARLRSARDDSRAEQAARLKERLMVLAGVGDASREADRCSN